MRNKTRGLNIEIKLTKKTGKGWLKHLEKMSKDKKYMDDSYTLIKKDDMEKILSTMSLVGSIKILNGLLDTNAEIVRDVDKHIQDEDVDGELKTLFLVTTYAHMSGLQNLRDDLADQLEELGKQL